MKTFELKQHNIPAAEGIKEGLKNGLDRICTVRATGTGKSYIIADIASEFGSVLFMAPTSAIIEQQKTVNAERNFKNTSVDYVTYSKAMYLSWDLKTYDLIICDECHRVLARQWKVRGIDRILEANPQAKVVGFTATNVRGTDKRDVVEEFFEGNVVEFLDLPKAWSDGILRTPRYIGSLYTLDNLYKEQLEKIEKSKISEEKKIEAKTILENFKIDWENSGGVPSIFKKYLHKNTRKMIFFLDTIDHIEEIMPTIDTWLKDSGFDPEYFAVHSLRNGNKKELEDFRKAKYGGKVKVMLSVNMLNEGIHVGEVDSVVFLRKTTSNVIYLQQLGRCLSFKDTKSKHPVVIDLVGNVDSAGTSISQLREKLIKIENEKISKGEKTEEDRVSFEIEGHILNQIKILEKIKNLYKIKDSKYYINLCKDIIERKAWEEATLSSNKTLYSWIICNKGRYECAKNIFFHINTKTNKKEIVDNIKKILNSKSFSQLSCKSKEVNWARLNKDNNPLAKLFYQEYQNNCGHNSRKLLYIARDVIKRQAWEEASYGINRALYDWARQHCKNNKYNLVCYTEADILLEKIAQNNKQKISIIIHFPNGSTKICDSLTEATKISGVSWCSINKSIKNRCKVKKGFWFEKKEED